MTPAEVLRKARARIERGWCRESFARDKGNRTIAPWRAEARRFCARGAMMVNGWSDDSVDRKTEGFLAEATGAGSRLGIECWNDDPKRTKAQVLRAFDRAIVLAEEGKP